MLEWRITDDISNLSVKEFDAEWNGIYGFMQLKIFKYCGFIPGEDYRLEGDDNIEYYIDELVECGICILKKTF